MPVLVYKWCQVNTIGEFQEYLFEYDIFEGSFIKDMIKLDNIVNELIEVTNILQKPALQKKLEDIHSYIVKDVISVDSLYLKYYN